MLSGASVILIFALIIIIMFSGHPIAFGLGGLSLYAGLIFWGPFPEFAHILTSRILGLMRSPIMISIPLFVFMGCILERSGTAERMFQGLHAWVGHIPGGMGVGALVICILLAASTGVVTASITMMGILALPSMLSRKYDKSLACGIVMVGGSLGVIIPPSVMLIVYGAYINLSVGRLFAASIFPGLILGLSYIVYVLIRSRINPALGPPLSSEEVELNWNAKLVSLKNVAPPAVLIFSVLGSIFCGIATPTEAAGVGCVVALAIAAINRKLTWGNLLDSTQITLKVVSMVMWILVGGACFQAVFSGLGGGFAISKFISNFALGPWGVLLLILAMLFVLGMIMDWIAILIIFMPTFSSLVTQAGFDPIWFATLYTVLMQIAFITPPAAGGLFFLKAVAPPEVTWGDLLRSTPQFIVIQLIVLSSCIIFPKIVMWLPNTLFN